MFVLFFVTVGLQRKEVKKAAERKIGTTTRQQLKRSQGQSTDIVVQAEVHSPPVRSTEGETEPASEIAEENSPAGETRQVETGSVRSVQAEVHSPQVIAGETEPGPEATVPAIVIEPDPSLCKGKIYSTTCRLKIYNIY